MDDISNLPTERIFELLEEMTRLELWGDSLAEALNSVAPEATIDLPPKPVLRRYYMELQRVTNTYRKANKTKRERIAALRKSRHENASG